MEKVKNTGVHTMRVLNPMSLNPSVYCVSSRGANRARVMRELVQRAFDNQARFGKGPRFMAHVSAIGLDEENVNEPIDPRMAEAVDVHHLDLTGRVDFLGAFEEGRYPDLVICTNLSEAELLYERGLPRTVRVETINTDGDEAYDPIGAGTDMGFAVYALVVTGRVQAIVDKIDQEAYDQCAAA